MLLRLGFFSRYVSLRNAATTADPVLAEVVRNNDIYRKKPKRNPVNEGIYRRLPVEYKKFYHEWKIQLPKPVHYIEQKGKFYKDEETGQVYPVINYPIPLEHCDHEDYGIWGGEAVIAAYKRLLKGEHRVHDLGPCPKFWYPELQRTVIYSEVLDLNMFCDMTKRALVLINEHNGLDYYLLETPACDLRNLLAIKLKRKILLALLHKSLYANDEVKREEVYDKYKKYLKHYEPEEIEWYGLTLLEARIKMAGINIKKKEEAVVPLKLQYRKEFIEELKAEALAKPEEKPWYKKKLLSFK